MNGRDAHTQKKSFQVFRNLCEKFLYENVVCSKMSAEEWSCWFLLPTTSTTTNSQTPRYNRILYMYAVKSAMMFKRAHGFNVLKKENIFIMEIQPTRIPKDKVFANIFKLRDYIFK